jgi:tripartite-type tricarboxylate transporter receptor subunit TctC
MALAALSGGMACAQNYPNKPIRVITSEPAAINDVTTRVLAQGLALAMGQQVIVDNRGGAGGAIAGEILAKATPDGYTLLSYGSSLWLAPFLRDKVNYNPLRDFAPITIAVSSPVVLVVDPSSVANSVRDLIALAKAKPSSLNYGSGGAGTTPHLAMELFKAMAGLDIVRVSYKAAGPAVNDLIGGQVQVMMVTAGSVMPHVKSGKLKALGVGSSKPSPLAAGLPTITSSGVPGYEFTSMWGIFAPAKTSMAIVRTLNQEMTRILKSTEIRERFLSMGVEAVGSTPEEFGTAVRLETKVLGKLIADLGIRND